MSSVYLIGDRNAVGVFKIGVTRGDLQNRLKKLQTGNCGQLYVVSHYESKHPFFIEQSLHRKYAQNKVLNEWFELTEENVKSFIQDCMAIEDIIDATKDNPYMEKILH